MIIANLASAICLSRELDLELVDPGTVPLIRLYQYEGSDWEETPEVYRNARVDPPPGHKEKFSVLYMADTIEGVAMECRLMAANADDSYHWLIDQAQPYSVARYSHSHPAIFLPIDGKNCERIGLGSRQRKFGSYISYQEAALNLYLRFGQTVHGLSWNSFTRGQPGRIYALWHRHKATIGLSLDSPAPHRKFVEDPSWLEFLKANPDVVGRRVKEVDSAANDETPQTPTGTPKASSS